jgi:hypothetical protein
MVQYVPDTCADHVSCHFPFTRPIFFFHRLKHPHPCSCVGQDENVVCVHAFIRMHSFTYKENSTQAVESILESILFDV